MTAGCVQSADHGEHQATGDVLTGAPNLKTLCMEFSALISGTTKDQLINAVNKSIKEYGTNSLYIFITTHGGQVWGAGDELCDFLLDLPRRGIQTTTHAVGIVDSMGAYVFLAGQIRRAIPSATFLFHPQQITIAGQVSPQQLRQINQTAELTERTWANILQSTRFSPDLINFLLKTEVRINAQEALNYGVIQEIRGYPFCNITYPAIRDEGMIMVDAPACGAPPAATQYAPCNNFYGCK